MFVADYILQNILLHSVSTGKQFCHSRESGNANSISREFPGSRELMFYLIQLEKGHFLRNKMQYYLTLYSATRLFTIILWIPNCGFLSKFVTVDGKYQKCRKNIHFYSINHIPGNPGPISRESGNGKIVGIPGNRKREISGMKHYYHGHLVL
jgi:hypothetical protein